MRPLPVICAGAAGVAVAEGRYVLAALLILFAAAEWRYGTSGEGSRRRRGLPSPDAPHREPRR